MPQPGQDLPTAPLRPIDATQSHALPRTRRAGTPTTAIASTNTTISRSARRRRTGYGQESAKLPTTSMVNPCHIHAPPGHQHPQPVPTTDRRGRTRTGVRANRWPPADTPPVSHPGASNTVPSQSVALLPLVSPPRGTEGAQLASLSRENVRACETWLKSPECARLIETLATAEPRIPRPRRTLDRPSVIQPNATIPAEVFSTVIKDRVDVLNIIRDRAPKQFRAATLLLLDLLRFLVAGTYADAVVGLSAWILRRAATAKADSVTNYISSLRGLSKFIAEPLQPILKAPLIDPLLHALRWADGATAATRGANPISQAEALKLMREAAPHYRPLIVVMWLRAARCQDCREMREGSLWEDRTGEETRLAIEVPAHKARHLGLVDHVYVSPNAEMWRILHASRLVGSTHPTRPPNERELMWNWLTTEVLTEEMRRVLGRSDVSAHSIRKGAIHHLIKMGVDLATIQLLSLHRSLEGLASYHSVADSSTRTRMAQVSALFGDIGVTVDVEVDDYYDPGDPDASDPRRARRNHDAPLKPIVARGVDIRRVRGLVHPRYGRYLDQAVAIMDGSHPCWERVYREQQPRSRARCRLTPAQVRQLVSFRVLEPASAGESLSFIPVYAVPKSDPAWSRPIADGRFPNGWILHETLIDRGKFHLPTPAVLVRVGMAVDVEDRDEPTIWVADMVSWFPNLIWSRRIAARFAVHALGRDWIHAAPAQGCSLLPLVAQTVTCALVGAPTMDARVPDWIRAGISVYLDDICLAQPRAMAERRVRDITAMVTAAGASLSVESDGIAQTAVVCGLEFDLRGVRRWRLKPRWCEKHAGELSSLLRQDTPWALSRLAGLAIWYVRAAFIPFYKIFFLMRPRCAESDIIVLDESARERELEWLVDRMQLNPWRTLSSRLYVLPDLRTMTIIFSDASIYGAGLVMEEYAWSVKWADAPRSPRTQQFGEAQAALLALRVAARWARPILLVVDNIGVQYSITKGVFRHSMLRTELASTAEQLELSRCPVWVAFCPGVGNPADGPSRPGRDRRAGSVVEVRERWSVAPEVLRSLRSNAMDVLWTFARDL